MSAQRARAARREGAKVARAATAVLIALALTWIAIPARAQSALPPDVLARLRFELVGARLVVDPPTLTVPKDVPTAINATLALPPGIDPATASALATLAADAEVVAELRGPARPPTEIRVRAGTPIPIPGFPLAGDYVLDGIRLERDGQRLLDATPSRVAIQVIDRVLVTSVTTRPLSLQEIQQRGILIDATSFDAYAFQLALDVDGTPLRIDLPVVLPKRNPPGFQTRPAELIEFAQQINRTLAATQTIDVPPPLRRPGLNITALAVPFFPTGDEDGGRRFDAPPLVGLVVIPGDVAFLNQFFSAIVQVQNVAPTDSRLAVRDVSATITLPVGDDRVPGTPAAPGDDPLRLARLDGGVVRDRIDLRTRGADGAPGTADDGNLVGPGASAEGEFLIEGLHEGAHDFEIALTAVLEGLPTGPVSMEGSTAGAVLVRDPRFSIAFSHPRTVRTGEPYDLWVTLTNTTAEVANLASVRLDPRAVSGARLVSADSVTFQTLGPFESGTARFELVAQRTGSVTASSITVGPGLTASGLVLRTGVDERDVALAPNRILLPSHVRALPPALVAAAQRVLGQTLGVAHAPAGSLPPGVLAIGSGVLQERARSLGMAGRKLELGDTLERVAADLLLDWQGAGTDDPAATGADAGFDQILRETNAGRDFLLEVGRILAGTSGAVDALAAHDAFVDSTVPRTPAFSASIAGRGGATPSLLLRDAAGRSCAPGACAIRGVARTLLDASLTPAELLVALAPLGGPLSLELAAGATDDVDLSLALAIGPGHVLRLAWAGVGLPAGGRARIALDPVAPAAALLAIDLDADGVVDEVRSPLLRDVQEGTPRLLALQQLDRSVDWSVGDVRDPATHGILIAALFDRAMDVASAEDLAHWAVEANLVIATKAQPGARIVYAFLQKGIGTWIPRTGTLGAIADARGQGLASVTRTIRAVLSDGAEVAGQAIEADGTPVTDAPLSLGVMAGQAGYSPSAMRTDSQGRYAFDFVRRTDRGFAITVQHPRTLDVARRLAGVRGPGEQLLVNVVFTGSGFVRGRVLESDGKTPAAGALVRLHADALRESWSGIADGTGSFVIAGVTVGGFHFRVDGVHGGSALGSGAIDAPGAAADLPDLVLSDPSIPTGRVDGRVFRADGTTPADGVTVYLGSYDRRTSRVSAIDRTTADAAGGFAFENAPANVWEAIAVDLAAGEVASARVSVAPAATRTVNVVFEPAGEVEGIVRDASGVPVAGALVSGGTAIGTTDASGRYLVTGVPVGTPVIRAGDPVRKRTGEAPVTVLPGRRARVDLVLEARASIVGVVRDAAGTPVPNVTVRIPGSLGFFFVFADAQGRFLFPNMALGDYLVQAPGPSREGLIAWMQEQGIPLEAAFTLGVPPEYGGGTAPPPQDERLLLRAYAKGLEALFSVSTDVLDGSLPPTPPGGYGWSRAIVANDDQIEDASVQYVALGDVAGTTIDQNGLPISAEVSISAVVPGNTGAPRSKEIGRMRSDLATGAFSFPGIVSRFDLATFQRARVRTGPFSVLGIEPFSARAVTQSGQLDSATPNRRDLVLQWSASDDRGTLGGTVFAPDGITPAPANTEVFIPVDATGITVRTDDQGRFDVALPIRAGAYALQATDPVSGLRGAVDASVRANEHTDVSMRLLGKGDLRVIAQRPGGTPLSDALVRVERPAFPGDDAAGTASASGEIVFTGLFEGSAGVRVEERGTGLVGRASVEIVRDGVASVVVTIRASGSVTGVLLGADGLTPVPNAEVVLAGSGTSAYTQSDAQGAFALDAIPAGRFTVRTFDPASRRPGEASGTLLREGDHVHVIVRQQARGSVLGVVTAADGTTRIPGAAVTIHGSGSVGHATTARADGSFVFPAVAAGTFTLEAVDPVTRFRGEASGVLRFEDEVVRQDVVLDPAVALRVRVVDPAGQPVSPASVTIAGPRSPFVPTTPLAVDANGEVVIAPLPVGTYTASARSLAVPADQGISRVVLDGAVASADLTLILVGTGEVTVDVVDAFGLPADGASVRLDAGAAIPGDATATFGQSFTGSTDPTGRIVFAQVPRGAFSVRAELGTVSGVSDGTIFAPGEQIGTSVELGPAGSVVGRVLLPDAATPAAETIVTLRFVPRSRFSTGRVQMRTDLAGSFAFAGIPLGAFSLEAFENVSLGVARLTDSLDPLGQPGQVRDLGTLVLDATSPRVVSSSPVDGDSAVPRTSAIVLELSERIDPATLRTSSGAANLLVEMGTAGARHAIAGTVTLENGDTRIVFVPDQLLPSETLVSVTLLGAPDGPRDLAQLPVVDAFVASFLVEDDIPPTLVSVAPAADETGVRPDAVLRLQFSEAMSPALVIRLRDDTGTDVAGDTVLSLGGTTAIFTPRGFLDANRQFVATVLVPNDVAGNAIATDVQGAPLPPGAPFELRFASLDTLPPRITALALAGMPSRRAGSRVTAVPTLPDADTVAVEWHVAGSTPVLAMAPFTHDLVLPAVAGRVDLTAAAIDAAGNRSAPRLLPIDVIANAPPVVSISRVGGSASVRAGARVELRVQASDDEDVARVAVAASGALVDASLQATVGQRDVDTLFVFDVPPSASTGAHVLFTAGARDDAGLDAAPASVDLTVEDSAGPSVAITAPLQNAQVAPGETLDVDVDTGDAGGLSSVTLTCVPQLAGCGARLLTGGPPRHVETFRVDVPAALRAPGSITLVASALDLAGNPSAGGAASVRTLRLADVDAPVITLLASESGSARVSPGERVSLLARAADDVGVRGITLRATGAVTASVDLPVSPPVTSAEARLVIDVPPGATPGSVVHVEATARDGVASGVAQTLDLVVEADTSAPVPVIVTPLPNAALTPGSTLSVRVQASDDRAVVAVRVVASGAFDASVDRPLATPGTPADETVPVSVPSAARAGAVRLRAEARDAAGNVGSVEIDLRVADVVAPQASIATPVAGSSVDPRLPLAVVVDASDETDLASLALRVTGDAALDETRPVSGTNASESFTIAFASPPIEGGQVSLVATARDAAGNTTTATRTLAVQDVVAPRVTGTTPADGSLAVPFDVIASVVFAERMDAASLVAATRLETAGGAPVLAGVAAAPGDRAVVVTPVALLAPNTGYVLRVGTSATDRAGNPLAAPLAVGFSTAQPDATGPRVIGSAPVHGETGVAVATPIRVTFDEPLDPASVDATSFSVQVAAAPVAGQLDVRAGDPIVRFTLAAPLPLDTDVDIVLAPSLRDRSGNGLTDATGTPLAAPLVLRFHTASFSLVAPGPGQTLVEGAETRLIASASASLGVSTVRFEVNGAVVGTSAAPFSTLLRVPLASVTPSLQITAIALDGGGREITRDVRDVAVVAGLRFEPQVVGVPLGGRATLRLVLTSPRTTDLDVALAPLGGGAGVPALVTLPAGATEVLVPVDGLAVGGTAIEASSVIGDAFAIASVSVPASGRPVTALATPVGVGLRGAPSAGFVLVLSGGSADVDVTLLSAPAPAGAIVVVSSSAPGIASGSASIAAGEVRARVHVVGGADGVAKLSLSAAGVVRTLTVVVGVPPPGLLPVVVAAPVGLSQRRPFSAGTVVSPVGTSGDVRITILSAPALVDLPVNVTSSDPAIAVALGSAVVRAGDVHTTLTVRTGGAGTATLTVRAGSDVRELRVISGLPPQGALPIVVAAPVGVTQRRPWNAGTVSAPANTTTDITITLLDTPASQDLPVVVTSTDLAIASVLGTPIVRAGERTVRLSVTTGLAGAATLTVRAGGGVRSLGIVSGPLQPGQTPIVVATPVGVGVAHPARLGVVHVTAGSRVLVPARLFALPAPVSIPVTTTSSDPAVASLATPAIVAAGAQEALLDVVAGVPGRAVLELRAGLEVRRVEIVVGSPVETPAVLAPGVGVEVQ